MVRILFVCHGNICRSPMAEFLFKDFVSKKGVMDQFYIESAATSREEIGNSVHYGTKKILNSLGIDCKNKRARQITEKDYEKFDLIIAMDDHNIYNMKKIFNDRERKIHLLLEFAGLNRDISDPWYTGNFQKTYEDVMMGIEGLYEYILKRF